MSSPEDYSPSPLRTSLSRTASIGGDKSRSRSMLTKDMSIDEGDALKKISEEVEINYNYVTMCNYIFIA